MTAESLIAELENRGVTIEAAGGELRLDAPPGAVTADLLTTVKNHKSQLLALLLEPAKVSKADAEFARFERVAEPMPDGSGWYDPTQEPVPAGIPIEDWQRFIDDCRNLGKGARA